MIAVFAFGLFLIVSCGDKECKFNKDCAQRTCYTATCADNMCEYSAESDCCGNNDCETNEDKFKRSN